jgi:uncharacterized protein YigE (DUF2233 family)
MYANLRVTTPKGKVLHAHRVEIEDGKTKVYLDRNDGAGNYAEPGGVLNVPGDVKIEADY